jgi:hypothetical protein
MQKWARAATDRFVLAGPRIGDNLAPSKEADRRTLLTRLSYDLQGLAPTEADLREFAADASRMPIEKAVDRLMASPRFGERWGRYWLDVARYSEYEGTSRPINADRRFHFAYSYRIT